jgi:hypothetical protein
MSPTIAKSRRVPHVPPPLNVCDPPLTPHAPSQRRLYAPCSLYSTPNASNVPYIFSPRRFASHGHAQCLNASHTVPKPHTPSPPWRPITKPSSTPLLRPSQTPTSNRHSSNANKHHCAWPQLISCSVDAEGGQGNKRVWRMRTSRRVPVCVVFMFALHERVCFSKGRRLGL